MANNLDSLIDTVADKIAASIVTKVNDKLTGKTTRVAAKPVRAAKAAAEAKPTRAKKAPKVKRVARAKRAAKPIGESKSSDANKAMFAGVLKFITENPGATMGSITTALGITDKRKATYALATLRKNGSIKMHGDRRSASYKAASGAPSASNGAVSAEA